VLDDDRRLIGVLTRRDIVEPSIADWIRVEALIRRAPAVAYEDNSVREAADHMVLQQVGRLPVVSREDPHVVVGMISRSDLLSAHRSRLKAMRQRHRVRLTTFWSEL
jgi:CBS domain-containing protein